jgi:MOSC domain-containing protein YiiM
MKQLNGTVVSVHSGKNEDLSKQALESIEVDFEGIAGDAHRGISRTAFSGEREPKGTILRNDRQWSGVSVEELAVISEQLELTETLRPDTLGANICVQGIPDFSLLPRGTRLVFPSGAALIIEEYNPACSEMGEQVVAKYQTHSSAPLTPKQWLKPAHGRRGVVGMVDVAGTLSAGDKILVQVFEEPRIQPY